MPSNIPLWTFGVAFRLRLVTFTEQAHPSYRHLSGIPAWRRGSSDRSSARRPYPQVSQCHPRVAKGTSIDPLTRGPSTEALLGQGHVARLSGSGVKPVSCRCFGRTSARHPRREASRWHPGVAKRTSIDPLARGLSTEALLGQGHVARLSGTGVKPVSCRCFGRTSARHPLREASRWHPGVARQSSIGSSSIKCRCSMDIEVRIGCLSMKCRCFMEVEVRMGCLSMKCRCSMDIEVRIGCLYLKCRCFMDVEVQVP